MEKVFRHLDITEGGIQVQAGLTLLARNEVIGTAVDDAASIIDAVMLTFCGMYPDESPYSAWGSLIELPWCGEYYANKDGVRSKPFAVEIKRIAADLLM